jgi:hypothetical protein
MQVKLLMLAIVLALCGCSVSPAPNPDTGFIEKSFGEGSSIKTKHLLSVSNCDYWIVEVIDNNKRTTLLQNETLHSLTMTVLSSEEVQAEKPSEKRVRFTGPFSISDNYIRDYGEKNGR